MYVLLHKPRARTAHVLRYTRFIRYMHARYNKFPLYSHLSNFVGNQVFGNKTAGLPREKFN